MPTYKKADLSVTTLVNTLLNEHECFKWIREIELKIDFIFAYGTRNEDGELVGDAIKHHGVCALGLCRIVPLKDRAMGRGDAEIVLDADWWVTVDDEKRLAVLDHELFHLQLKKDADDLGRPKLKLRKHDFQFGWFTAVAERHGVHAQERKQAASILDQAGQFYWPGLVQENTVQISTANVTTGPIPLNRFNRIASEMAGKK